MRLCAQMRRHARGRFADGQIGLREERCIRIFKYSCSHGIYCASFLVEPRNSSQQVHLFQSIVALRDPADLLDGNRSSARELHTHA